MIILKNHEKMFAISRRLRRVVLDIIQKNVQADTVKDVIAVYMLSKTFKTHSAVMKLVEMGYEEDADMLVRTMFDSALIIGICLNDSTDESSIQYLKFDDSIRAKMFKQLKDGGNFREYFDERIKNPKPNDDSIEEIDRRAEEWIKQYGKNFWQKWYSDKTMGDLADAVGLKQYYKTAYSLQSQLSHSLTRFANRYIVDNGSNLLMDVEPKDSDLQIPLISSFNMLFFVTEKFNTHFKVVPEDIFKDLANDLKKTVTG
jgi:hypothetical protein